MAELATGRPTLAVRNVELGDLPAVYRLYRSVEPEDEITQAAFERWWRWLYAESWTRPGFALGSFDSSGEILGHAAVSPFTLVVDGEPVVVGFVGLLMVAESQRQTMLYPLLTKKLLRSYPQYGCEFCYNEVTRPRVLESNVALGFHRGGVLPIYARPYRLDKLIRSKLGKMAWLAKPVIVAGEMLCRIGSPFSGGAIAVSQVPAFPPEAEPFLDTVRGHFKLAALRSVGVLNWRFTGNADRKYRILLARDGAVPVGYAVLRRMAMKSFDALALVDFLFDLGRPEVGHALLRQVHRIARAEGVDLSATMISSESPYLSILWRWGFLPTPEKFTLITHEPKNGRHRINDRPFSDWHLTWFDHDFV